jgi:hypothetical protein
MRCRPFILRLFSLFMMLSCANSDCLNFSLSIYFSTLLRINEITAYVLSCLVSMFLQAGAMLGDSFLHQLPHAFGIPFDQC